MRWRLIVRTSALVGALAWALIGSSKAQADLVGWWPFDGDVSDKSGLGNDGELFDATFIDAFAPATGGGKSLNFEDDTQHVYIEDDASLDSEIFTLSMFIFDAGQEGHMERLTSRAGDTFETALNVHPPFNGVGEVSFYPGEGGWRWGTYVPPPEEWVHLAWVADGENMTIYADGEVILGPEPFTAFPTGYMHIGNRHNDVEGFNGVIDDVALWDEALTEAEVKSLATGARRPNTLRSAGTTGDFDGNGTLDVADLDLLHDEAVAATNGAKYDLNGDKLVDNNDVLNWVRTLRKTWVGDANVDGVFDSGDFVAIFTQGKYESGQPAKWSEGDWNSDGLFNSGDLVAAFSEGGYEQGPRAAVAAVPEPASLGLLVFGICGGLLRGRRKLR